MSRRNLLFGLLGLIAGAFLFTLWRDPETFRQTFTASESRPRPQTVARTTRPASRTVTSTNGTTLLRELPRQALLITAAHEFGLPACDRSVDFAGADQGTRLHCEVAFHFGGPSA